MDTEMIADLVGDHERFEFLSSLAGPWEGMEGKTNRLLLVILPYQVAPGDAIPTSMREVVDYVMAKPETLIEGMEKAAGNPMLKIIEQAAELVEAMHPETLEAVADEITEFHHSARVDSLRVLARKMRTAMKRVGGEENETAAEAAAPSEGAQPGPGMAPLP